MGRYEDEGGLLFWLVDWANVRLSPGRWVTGSLDGLGEGG